MRKSVVTQLYKVPLRLAGEDVDGWGFGAGHGGMVRGRRRIERLGWLGEIGMAGVALGLIMVLGPRLRGDDVGGFGGMLRLHSREVGVAWLRLDQSWCWVPACAGMTLWRRDDVGVGLAWRSPIFRELAVCLCAGLWCWWGWRDVGGGGGCGGGAAGGS